MPVEPEYAPPLPERMGRPGDYENTIPQRDFVEANGIRLSVHITRLYQRCDQLLGEIERLNGCVAGLTEDVKRLREQSIQSAPLQQA